MKLFHWLRQTDEGGLQDWQWVFAYVATLLLPLGLIFNRVFMEAACIVVGLLFIWNSVSHKQWQWLRDPVVRAGFILWLWLLIPASAFAILPMASLKMALMWIRFLLVYAALRHWVLTERRALQVLAIILVAMFGFIIVDTLWQYITGVSFTGHERSVNGRLTGPFDNLKVGIFTAKMFIPTAVLCLFFSWRAQKRVWLFASIFFCLASVTVILLSGERTAFVSAAIAITCSGLLFVVIEPNFRRIFLMSLVLIAFLVGGLFYTQPWISYRTKELFSTISSPQDSPYGQLFYAGYLLGKEHPITGAGLKGFESYCPSLSGTIDTIWCSSHPHNPYIENFAAAGSVGLVLFIMLIISMFSETKRIFQGSSGLERLVPALVMATLLVHFFPFMPTQSVYSNWPAMLLWYSVSIAMASLNLLDKKST